MSRPLVMGIVNVTPDSFSDGGRWYDAAAAVAHGADLMAAGADILDVGGESTRPGSDRVSEADELARVIPVVEGLHALGARVSIDTMRATVAAAAVHAGATVVNDVSGGQADPDMAPCVGRLDVDYVAMHWRGHSADMYALAVYDDVVAEVRDELLARVDALTPAGMSRDRVILDPGLGFAKRPEHSWAVMAALPELCRAGHRVLVGASRKGFLAQAGVRTGEARPPEGRDLATAVTSVLAAQAGAWAVRVHDVASTVAALDVWECARGARGATAASLGGGARHTASEVIGT